jgi:hypothetical protein
MVPRTLIWAAFRLNSSVNAGQCRRGPDNTGLGRQSSQPHDRADQLSGLLNQAPLRRDAHDNHDGQHDSGDGIEHAQAAAKGSAKEVQHE